MPCQFAPRACEGQAIGAAFICGPLLCIWPGREAKPRRCCLSAPSAPSAAAAVALAPITRCTLLHRALQRDTCRTRCNVRRARSYHARHAVVGADALVRITVGTFGTFWVRATTTSLAACSGRNIARNAQRATCNVAASIVAARNAQRAAVLLQQALLQHATRNFQQAASEMQRAACSVAHCVRQVCGSSGCLDWQCSIRLYDTSDECAVRRLSALRTQSTRCEYSEYPCDECAVRRLSARVRRSPALSWHTGRQHATHTWHACARRGAVRVQHATENMQHAPCNVRHATCNRQHAACNMQRATCTCRAWRRSGARRRSR